MKEEVVQQVKDTIKELQEANKANIKYRPYAQDISYAMKANSSRANLSAKEVASILKENNIVIEQPKPSKVLK